MTGTRPAPATLITLLHRFARYLRGVRVLALLGAALVLLHPLIGGALLWLVKVLIDQVLAGGRFDLLPGLLTGYAAVAATKLTLDYFGSRLDVAVTERIIKDVRTDLYGHLMRVSPGSAGGKTVGDLLAHLSGDVERVETLIYTGPLGLVADVVSALFFTVFLLLLSWKLTVVALVVVPPLALAMLRESPRVKRAARVARRQATGWFSTAEQRLGAATLVHAFGTHAHESERFERRCDAARRAELRTVALQSRLAVLIEATATVGGLVVLGVGAWEIHRGAMTLGSVVAFLGSVRSLYDPIRGVGKACSRFQRAAAGAQRVASLLDAPSAVQERPSARALNRVAGAVEFRNVSFGYSPGRPVLSGLSLRIEPGEMVAVVGPSGGGKSSPVRLLLRLYDPTGGAVLVDGVDIRDVTLGSLRQAIAVVLQEPFMFQGSIEDNLRYGRVDATRQSVEAAAQAAYAHSFISAMPRGYGSAVGPRGERLSGGQRQRLALARAMLREAPILVLDEATASVDGETGELIQDSVQRLAGQRTILVIGHTLSAVRRADRVLVLDQGRIVEAGSPSMLMEAGTRGHDLFAAQVGSYRDRR